MRPGGYSQSCDILPEFRDKYGQNEDCMNHIHRHIHTHSHTRIFFAQISCERHFFRSSANKEICDLKAIASFLFIHSVPPSGGSPQSPSGE